MDWSIILSAAAFGYLIGSIPFGLLLTRAFGLGDVRAIGSGNIGATNVLRTGNKKVAAITLLADMAKGTLPTLIVAATGGETASMVAGVAAFLGHCFPVWLRFKGGKGVATYIGVLIGFAVAIAGVFAIVWLAVAALTRYSSLAALIGALAAPLASVLLGYGDYLVPISVMTAMVYWRHRENITRLLSGSESRIGDKGTTDKGTTDKGDKAGSADEL